MTEQTTFNKLKRCSFKDIKQILEGIGTRLPMIRFNDFAYQYPDYSRKLTYHLELVKACEENGWNLDDLYMELEREVVISVVVAYNESIKFPQEVLDRAKAVFPNVKFTEAKIELE
jgi:hypothetical protein